MKKTITATIAALFMTTSLVGPAAADNDLLRLGIGVGAALIGEAMKGGGNHRQGGREPGRGDTLLGPVGGKQQPTRQARGKTKPAKADDAAQWASYVPTTPAIPFAKPTDEEMVAWAAAAPEREAQEQQAEAEMAQAPVVATDATTTAAVTGSEAPAADVAAVPSAAPVEEATEELRYGDQYWGKVTKTQLDKAMKFVSLGMSLPDAYRAIGLKGPIEEAAEPTGRDLIDENGRLWGNVPEEVAANVWKAVDMGMKPSDAIRAIAKLEDPDTVKAKAVADAEAAKAQDDKTLAMCIDKTSAGRPASTYWTECRPFEDQLVVVARKAQADYMAQGEEELAACIEKRLDPTTKDQRFAECKPLDEEVDAALIDEARMENMGPTAKQNYLNRSLSKHEIELRDRKLARIAAKNAGTQQAEADQAARAKLDEIFSGQSAPVAENKPAFSAPSAENQTAATPAVAPGKPAIDEDKTAAIEVQPEAAKPVEQKPAKKKMKLDL